MRTAEGSHSPSRELLPDERAALDFLLEAEFPGATGLRDQPTRARAGRRVSGTGILLWLEILSGAATPDGGLDGIPIEAEGKRDDGTPVHLLVHVQAGRLHVLEAYEADGAPMEWFPDPATLTRLEGPHWRSEGRSP